MSNKMKHLTNSYVDEIGEFLNTQIDTSRIVYRKPLATDNYTTQELLEMGMVGIYWLNEGEIKDFEKEHKIVCQVRDNENLSILPDSE